MWQAWERRGKCTRFWWESQKARDHSEDEDVDGSMGLGDRLGGGCFMLGTAARLLCTRWWTFGFWRRGVSHVYQTHTYLVHVLVMHAKQVRLCYRNEVCSSMFVNSYTSHVQLILRMQREYCYRQYQFGQYSCVTAHCTISDIKHRC
jgi:hypothetical protein